MSRVGVFALVAALCLCPFSHAQPEPGRSYGRLNRFSVFTEYSNDSSHIILGATRGSKLAALGVSYSRRILTGKFAEWEYGLEIRPLLLLGETTRRIVITTSGGGTPPVTIDSGELLTVRGCSPFTLHFGSGQGGATQTWVQSCGKRWTYAGGLSPLGQKVNFAPHHRIQPFVAGNAGFLVSPHDIPANKTSSFNFAFEFGAGLELYRARGRSFAVEYCVHHLSNDYIGANNPGIDSGVFKLIYSFGRQ